MNPTHPIAVSTLLMMAGCATTSFTPGAPPGAVDVIAHRGASAYAPENTLAAFQRAIEQGAEWFELDCHLTQDNAVIVIHDAKLERTAGVPGTVEESSLASLLALDAGSWFHADFAGERLPTLTESLLLAQGKIGVYVEIKSADDDSALMQALLDLTAGHTHLSPQLRQQMVALVEESGTRNLALTRAVIEEIKKTKMNGEVVIQSFSPIVCLVALLEAPMLRTEFLISKSEERPERWDQYMTFGKLIGVAGFNIHHESIDLPTLQRLHQEGRSVAAWTVDDPAIMTRLADWGVDAIITNKPDLALQTLREHNRHP